MKVKGSRTGRLVDRLQSVIAIHENRRGTIVGKAGAITLPFGKVVAVGGSRGRDVDVIEVAVVERKRRCAAGFSALVSVSGYGDAGIRITRLHRQRLRDRVSGAARELESGNSCLPVSRVAIGLTLVVLVDIPERAIIKRVNTHRTVVAPPPAWTTFAIVAL